MTDIGSVALDKKIVEQRYSVHLSQKSISGVDTIKQTIRLEGGEDIKTYNTTKALRESKFQILFARVTPTLQPEKYKFPRRQKDSLLNVCELDPSRYTLLYVVMVARNSLDSPLSSQTWRHARFDFKELSIFMLYSFSNLPSAPFGTLLHFINKPITIGDQKSSWDLEIENNGKSRDSLNSLLEFIFQNLHEISVDIAKDFIIRDDLLLAWKQIGPGFLSQQEFYRKIREKMNRLSR
ncbi:MAG: hypothetical protein ACK4NW_04910 [Roseinatronobacter sp.]